jgi:hypothetical protein
LDMVFRHSRTIFDFGIHSNIPECCVVAFCADEEAGVENIALNRAPGVNKSEFEYVPCLSCWEKYRAGELVPNKLHRCRGNNDCQRTYGNVKIHQS